jgi:hypothetical protein
MNSVFERHPVLGMVEGRAFPMKDGGGGESDPVWARST